MSIRPGSFETRFREVCDRLIPDSIFDKLYSNVGREARSPSVLTRLLLEATAGWDERREDSR